MILDASRDDDVSDISSDALGFLRYTKGPAHWRTQDTDMSKILVMTDLHLTEAGEQIIGLDPAKRFALCLSHAARAHPDADGLILTGDLAHRGTHVAYATLKKHLENAPWPVHMTLGNHDNRDVFKSVFPDAPCDPNGFVQTCLDLDDVRLILLDTLDEQAAIRHSGRLCTQRLDWLQSVLSDANDKPCLLLLHHPPFATGFSGMDAIGLTNAADLRDILKDSPVVHVLAGHIHRTITATFDTIPMTTFKSPCHQMPMVLGAHGSGHSVDEPGAYGIILTQGADVVVHFEDVGLPVHDTEQCDI